MKPWAALKIIGREGYGILFNSARENTRSFREILEARGNFEVLNSPELFILIYRFIPEPVTRMLGLWREERKRAGRKARKKAMDRAIRKVNHVINGLNIKLHKALRLDDTTFVSRTTLESTPYRPQNIVVLRAVPINPLTTRSILEEIVETQNRIGLRKEFEPAYRRALKDHWAELPSDAEQERASGALAEAWSKEIEGTS